MQLNNKAKMIVNMDIIIITITSHTCISIYTKISLFFGTVSEMMTFCLRLKFRVIFNKIWKTECQNGKLLIAWRSARRPSVVSSSGIKFSFKQLLSQNQV